MVSSRKTTPAIQAIFAALLFGASAPLSKLLLADISPVTMASLLYLGSGLAACIIIAVRSRMHIKSVEAKLNRQDIPWMILALLCGGVAAPILLMMGLSGTPAATASLLLNFESVATTIIAALVFREAIGLRLWSALGLITAGSMILSWHPGDAWGFSWQAAAIAGACLLWGLDNNFTRKISARNPLAIVAIKGLGAGVFSFLLSRLINEPLPVLGTAALALVVGAICYGASIALFVLAMRGLGAARTGTLFASAPFIGAIISIFVLRDIPNITFMIALPLLLAGVFIQLNEKHSHLHTHHELFHEHSHTHDTHHEHNHLEVDQHNHPHVHQGVRHDHEHAPDLHHRHDHLEM